MASMGDSMGDGGDAGGFNDNSGFAAQAGAGNVDTGVRNKPGTGYDEEGNVKTKMSSQMAGFHYDPVSGALAPEEEVLGGGGGLLGGYKDAIPGNFPHAYHPPHDDRDYTERSGTLRDAASGREATSEPRPGYLTTQAGGTADATLPGDSSSGREAGNAGGGPTTPVEGTTGYTGTDTGATGSEAESWRTRQA